MQLTRHFARAGLKAALAAAALTTLSLTAFSLTTPAQAAVPATLAMQGVLLSSGGGPAADGNYSVEIAIYPAENGGSAVWLENGVTLSAKNGQFSYLLGSKTPLSAAALSMAQAWVGIRVGSDPELPRRPLASVAFALRAASAEALDCSGCVKAGQLDAAALQEYAKTADLSDYVKATSLAKVAGTGAYADLSGKPVLAKVGASCGTNLLLRGIKDDGSYECVSAGISGDLLNEVSNDLIWNQFVDSKAGTKDVQIKDGFAAGVTDTLTFPDIGLAQKVWVDVSVGNSDLTQVSVELYAPGMTTPYLLYNGGKSGTQLTAAFNDTDKLVSGDLDKDWLGKNIKGNWSLTVRDKQAISLPPGTPPFVYDGKFNWTLNVQTLSSKKVQIKGNLIVDQALSANSDVDVAGNLRVGGQPVLSNFKYVLINNDFRNNSGTVAADTWAEVPARKLVYTKTRDSSVLRIQYQDTLGTLGSNYGQCNWRILVDGTAVSVFSDADLTYSGGWRMANGTHTALAAGLKAGPHTITVQTYRSSGAAECLMGWNTGGNFLSSEEVGP